MERCPRLAEDGRFLVLAISWKDGVADAIIVLMM
jgi:hypothetical protein